MMKLAVEQTDISARPALVVTIAGALDAHGAAVVVDVVRAALDLGHRNLVLDVEGVTHLDRAGAEVISEMARIVGGVAGSIKIREKAPGLQAMLAIFGVSRGPLTDNSEQFRLR